MHGTGRVLRKFGVIRARDLALLRRVLHRNTRLRHCIHLATMPARTIPKPSISSIPGSVFQIYDQVQNSTANHQKNLVALHKLHIAAATFTETVGDGLRLIGERAFEDAFLQCVGRVCQVKKGVAVGDRCVKFIGAYIKFVNERAAELKGAQIDEEEEEEDDDDTPTSRFISRLLRFLLKGFGAKDKIARYRAVQISAGVVSHLGEIDEEAYLSLRSSLLTRAELDRESYIRAQATVGLARLSGAEDPAETSPSAIEVLLGIMGHDSSA